MQNNEQGCIDPGRQAVVAVKFYTVLPNILILSMEFASYHPLGA
jgi:hypothetical protein